MDRLTEAQRRALITLAEGAISYKTWGTSLFTPIPKGIKNRGTLWALHRAGLARTWRGMSGDNWAITEAGRAALAKESGQ